MKKAISFLLIIVMLFSVLPATAGAEDATQPQAQSTAAELWDYAPLTGDDALQGVVLTRYKGSAEDVYVPSMIYTDDGDYPVLKLGDGVFENNTGITSATIGEGVAEIGEDAFKGAVNLVCVVSAESLTEIGAGAFDGCTAFNSVILYDAVTTIGAGAFAGCSALKIWCNENSASHQYAQESSIAYEIMNPANEPLIVTVDDIDYYVGNGEAVLYDGTRASGDVVIPSSVNGFQVTRIANRAFVNNKALASVVIPHTVTYIGQYAFQWTKIGSIVIPGSVKELDKYAFVYSTLDNLIIEEGVQAIREYCFSNADLSKMMQDNQPLVLPDSVTVLEQHAFCAIKVNEVVFSKNLTELPSELFCYSAGGGAKIRTVTIPEGVTTIEERTFGHCAYLTELNLPHSLVRIKNEAFGFCSSLTEVVLPSGLQNVYYEAFRSCSKLTSVTVPSSVTSISGAFNYCAKLQDVYYEGGLTSWQRICSSLGVHWDADAGEYVPINATIHYYYNTSAPTPTLISLNKTETDIVLYDVETLVATVEPAEYLDITWSSSDESVATVSNGKITTHKCGTIIVSAETQLGCLVAQCVVNVLPREYTFVESATTQATWSFDGETLTISGTGSIYGDLYSDRLGPIFQNRDKIKRIVFGEGVTEMRMASSSSIIPDARYVEEYVFPSTLTKYVEYAGRLGTSRLRRIVVSEDNPIFSADDSALYNTETHTLLRYFSAKSDESYTVPDYITRIYRYAFSGSPNLTSVVMPNSVTEIDTCAFYSCRNLTDITISNSISAINSYTFSSCTGLTNITIPNSVTSIGDSAFENCTGLTSIAIPGSVTSIGNKAFSGCTALSDISIPDSVITIGVGAFWSCSSLTSLTIPDSVTTTASGALAGWPGLIEYEIPAGTTSIASNAFSGCSSLARITIPDSVVSIGNLAFSHCTELEEITIPEGVKSLGSSVFNGCTSLTSAVLPNSVESFYGDIFSGCTNLASVTLPYEASVIGSPVFSNNAALTSIVLPRSVTSISNAAFSGCTALTSVVLPDDLTTIGEYAFRRCENLTSITLPDSLKSLGHGAFWECTALADITIPGSLTVIGTNAFYRSGLNRLTILDGVAEIGHDAFGECANLSYVSLPASLKRIGGAAFTNCRKIKSITIPDGVETIDGSAFYNCSILTTVIISDSVTGIGDGAFDSCRWLNKVVLGNSVNTIGDRAFNNCVGLSEIIIPSSTDTIGQNAFKNCSNLRKVYLPEGVSSIDPSAFDGSRAILYVSEGSYAHHYAVNNNLLYFIRREANNPEIAYGTGISGTVTYTNGTPASGAIVTLAYDDGMLKETVSTDETGAYTFTYAEVGKYTITATDANGSTASETVAVKRINAFDVFRTGDTALTLKTGYTVIGTVSQGGATVTISDLNGNVIADTTADDSGAYSISGIPNGEYVVKAETANGSAAVEITVFNADVTAAEIVIQVASAQKVTGTVYAKAREGHTYTKTYAQVIIYNAAGVTLGSTRTDENGVYDFGKLPAGEYYLVAETTEMREDRAPLRFFERPYALRGYTYLTVTDTAVNGQKDIIMVEQSDRTVRFTGSVKDGNGRYQACTLALFDMFNNELDRLTITNGRFYATIPEGVYKITATTPDGRFGSTTIGLFNGEPQGTANIVVSKSDKIAEHEAIMAAIPNCTKHSDAVKYRDEIVAEKRFYDSLSAMEKNQLSNEYVEKLDLLVTLLCNYNYHWQWFAANRGNTLVLAAKPSATVRSGADLTSSVANGGLLISAAELENGSTVELSVSAREVQPAEIGESGVTTGEEYVQLQIEDAAEGYEIAAYYNLTVTKTVDGIPQTITDVRKNTDTTGSLLLTLPIDAAYQGHADYKIIRVHNGEITALADVDDNPNTVSFETDRFSTFVLAYSDEPLMQAEYAAKKGDADGDGEVNGKDITFLRRYLAGGYGVTIQPTVMDLNNDGEVNGKDVTFLRRYLVGGYGLTLDDAAQSTASSQTLENGTPWVQMA